MIENAVPHQHTGHCETGVSSILLKAAGLDLSEAMVLGLSSGISFAHFPFIKINELPLTSYRMPPGAIYRGLAKRIGLRWHQQRFRDADKGMAALDQALENGHAVGIQASVYWLPYFPTAMRFHFNAHNLIVYGRDGDDYLISDPVFQQTQRCPSDALRRARFVRGALAPKGLMYWPQRLPESVDLGAAALKSIRKTANMMLRAPLPFVGVKGIGLLGRHIARLPAMNDPHRARLYLAQIVRMQEEIGTGGGGFRFMYAAFLREAADLTGSEMLLTAERQMTEAGDAWRQFALACAKQIRSKNSELQLDQISAHLQYVADLEHAVFKPLLKAA